MVWNEGGDYLRTLVLRTLSLRRIYVYRSQVISFWCLAIFQFLLRRISILTGVGTYTNGSFLASHVS